jgi:hypothetical protein
VEQSICRRSSIKLGRASTNPKSGAGYRTSRQRAQAFWPLGSQQINALKRRQYGHFSARPPATDYFKSGSGKAFARKRFLAKDRP